MLSYVFVPKEAWSDCFGSDGTDLGAEFDSGRAFSNPSIKSFQVLSKVLILTSTSSHFGQTLAVMEAPIDRSIDRSGCCERSAHFLTQKGLWIVWVWLSREGGSSGSLLLLYWSVVTQKPHTGQMIDWTIHSVLTDCVSSPPSVIPLVFPVCFPFFFSPTQRARHKPPKNRRICSHTFVFIGSRSDNLSEASSCLCCHLLSTNVTTRLLLRQKTLQTLFHRVQRSVGLLLPNFGLCKIWEELFLLHQTTSNFSFLNGGEEHWCEPKGRKALEWRQLKKVKKKNQDSSDKNTSFCFFQTHFAELPTILSPEEVKSHQTAAHWQTTPYVN